MSSQHSSRVERRSIMNLEKKRTNKRLYNRKWMAKRRCNVKASDFWSKRSVFSPVSSCSEDGEECKFESIAQSITPSAASSIMSSTATGSNVLLDFEKESYSPVKTGNVDARCLDETMTLEVCGMGSDRIVDETSNSNQPIVLSTYENLCNSSQDCPQSTFASQLRHWALEYQCSQSSLDSLLKLLRLNGHIELPNSARTFLSTSNSVSICKKSGLQYCYLGFKDNLEKLAQVSAVSCYKLALNIDGVPLFKSSSNGSLWPILCRIVNVEEAPVFPVALALGSSKPQNLDFLNDSIIELQVLIENGICLDGKVINIELSQIVCDAPARSMCKATKLYSGYYGCERCSIKGEYDYRKVLYTQIRNLKLRTDVDFRSKQNAEHHTGDSPFCQLDIDMVNSFPIDYMHQVLLGVQRKLLNMWTTEIKGPGRITRSQTEIVSKRLLKLRPCTPSEFPRKPRPLKELPHYKATEFRTFLLYTGKVVMKSILDSAKYEHFLCLSVALCILVSNNFVKEHSEFARKLLINFVSDIPVLYGKQYLVYNMHSLLHIVDQTELFGSLDQCSAFTFENYMQTLKKFVKKGNQPLVQIVSRIRKIHDFDANLKRKSSVKFKTKPPNNIYLTKDNEIVELTAARPKLNQIISYVGRKFLNPGSYFKQPCDSRKLGIYTVNPVNTCLKVIKQTMLSSKCFKMVCDDTVIVQVLLHGM